MNSLMTSKITKMRKPGGNIAFIGLLFPLWICLAFVGCTGKTPHDAKNQKTDIQAPASPSPSAEEIKAGETATLSDAGMDDAPDESAGGSDDKVIHKEDFVLTSRREFFVLKAKLKGSLLKTLIDGLPDNVRLCRVLASETEEALHFQMDTRRQMSKEDVATLVFKEGGRGVVARVYGVRYYSRILDRNLRAYYFWEAGKDYPEYFDADGVSLTPRLKRPPLAEYQRLGRMAGKNPSRQGIFFLAKPETEIIAPFTSKVLRINWLPPEEGKCVELSYEGTGVSAVIKGLGSLSVKVNPGATVKSGDIIGRVADAPAGKASGFRYLVRSGVGDGAIGVDPFRFHLTTKYKLDKTSRGLFLSVKQKVDDCFAALDQASLEEEDSPGDAAGLAGG